MYNTCLILSLLFSATTGFFWFPTNLRVIPGIDVRRTWRAYISNPTNRTITTRVRGTVLVHDGVGIELDRYSIPLRGLHLNPGEMCSTFLGAPLNNYTTPTSVTCFIEFVDSNQTFKETTDYCCGGYCNSTSCKEKTQYSFE